MPFEEFAPARPPAKTVVGRDEVLMAARPHLRAAKDARFADKRMVEVTIGAGVALRLGWIVTAQARDAAPALPKLRVLFGSGADLGKMQIVRGAFAPYKPRALKGGGGQAHHHRDAERRADRGFQGESGRGGGAEAGSGKRPLPAGDAAGGLPAVVRRAR
ncbi:MAG: hypothetical protein Kow00114_27270 [Kiloniellaceae bacterium]